MYNLICTAAVYDKSTIKGVLLTSSSDIVARGHINQDWEFYSIRALQHELENDNVMFMTAHGEPFQLELTEKMINYLLDTYCINSKKCAKIFASYASGIVKFNYGDILRAMHNRFVHAASVTKLRRGLPKPQYLVHIWGNYTPDFQAFMSGCCPILAAQATSYNCNHMVYTLSEEMLVHLCMYNDAHRLLPYLDNCTLHILDDTLTDNYAKDKYYLRTEIGESLQEVIDKYYLKPDEIENYAKDVLGKSIWTWSELTGHIDEFQKRIEALA